MKPKLFIPYNIAKIKQINGPEGRLYETPSGAKYPSITTILGIESIQYITEWRNRVGHEVANEISRKAASRGSIIHKACEKMIVGEQYEWGMFDAGNREMFECLIPVIESIEEVHAMETKLYSDRLETAGTVDLIARIDGELTILDWKTSTRYKTRDDIHSYFTQTAYYAYAFFERTGVLVPNITIAMTVQDIGLVVFKEKVKTWLPAFLATRERFRVLKGF
jgi:genome maintenance exonuclease 1